MSDINHPHSPAALEADIRQSLDDALCARRPGDCALIARVKERVLTAVSRKTSLLHRTVRAEGGSWETVSTGVERKLLWESGDAFSCLMRLAPGAVVAGHSHPIDEECVVLEGSLRIGTGLVLYAGDFHVGVSGVEHDVASTDTGAVVYLRSARPKAESVS